MTKTPIEEALHPGTSEDRLSQLAYDQSVHVRKAVASHPNTLLWTLQRLAETFPDEVARNPSFAAKFAKEPEATQRMSEQSAIAFATLEHPPAWLLEALTKCRYGTVDAVLAVRPRLTPELRTKLRSLRGGDLQLFLLQDPDCPEDLFLRIVRWGHDETIPHNARMDRLLHRHVARMKNVPAVVLDYLRTSPDEEVRAALDRRGLSSTPGQRRFTLRHATATDVGHERQHNEDKVGAWAGERRAMYAVADGMGGGSSGDVAAEAAVETLVLWAKEKDSLAPQDLLHHACVAAHYHLRVKERTRHITGSGTTLVAALIEGENAYIANNGDSRAYLVRDGEITLLTQDHSLLNEYLKVYPLTPQEIEDFPHKNVLVRSLGFDPIYATPDIFVQTLQLGDRLLLCTDGLYKMLSAPEMLRIIEQGTQVEAIAKALIDAVLQTKAEDNIALVVVDVGML